MLLAGFREDQDAVFSLLIVGLLGRFVELGVMS